MDRKITFPPNAGNLEVDVNLKLSRSNFKQSLMKYKSTPYELINIYPTPKVLAELVLSSYQDYNYNEYERDYEKRLKLPDGWKLLTTATNNQADSGYFGVSYWHPVRHQVVIVHRVSNCAMVDTDVSIIRVNIFKHSVSQINSAVTFADEISRKLIEVEQELGIHFQVFLMGHSLGGWLAQITTFTIEYLKKDGVSFVRSPNSENAFHAHTVVFDSPGCKEMILEIESQFDLSVECYHKTLDIITYLYAPNVINTCNTHLGTVYQIFVDMEEVERFGAVEASVMKKIHAVFDLTTEEIKQKTVISWPNINHLKCDGDLKDFLKSAKLFYNSQLKWSSESCQDPIPNIHDFQSICYQIEKFDERVMSLNVFKKSEREFSIRHSVLQCLNLSSFFNYFKCELGRNAKSLVNNQQFISFRIDDDTIIDISDYEFSSVIIPTLQLLVQIISTKNDEQKIASHYLYQSLSDNYVRELEKVPLDFNGNRNLEIFLRNKEQQIWQLLVTAETQIFVKQAYRALQKERNIYYGNISDCCIVLDLKRLLDLNEILNFNQVLLSKNEPYLVLLEYNLPVTNSGVEEFFKNIFPILLENQNIKIILILEQNNAFAKKFQEESIRILSSSKFLITASKNLTWNDLTLDSQKLLMEKSIEFQGKSIFLNELIDMNDRDVLDTVSPMEFLKNISIGEKIQSFKGYSKICYFDRYLGIQAQIDSGKQHGFVSKRSQFNDLTAFNENDFISLCNENPTKNVHWLSLHLPSEQYIWKKSQGSITELIPHVKKGFTLYFSETELINNKLQKIVIIFGLPGEGKTTLMTHLCKLIKKTRPFHWVVKFNLTDYTSQLNERNLKGGFKGQSVVAAIKFLSQDLLKLKNPLEIALFKQSFDKVGKMTLFFDGLDELIANHQEIILDLLQILKSTAVEKIWITTSSYTDACMRQFEQRLQQFCYTLAPWSEKEQIRLLANIWIHKLAMANTNNKSLQKIISCAEKLIEVSHSKYNETCKVIGSALRSSMLAKIYQMQIHEYCRNGPQPMIESKIIVPQLYQTYIDKFCQINEETFHFGNKESHKSVFNHDQLNYLRYESLTIFADKEVEENNDFLERHHTFADYCVGKFFGERLIRNKKPSQSDTKFLMQEILLQLKYRLIRFFMNKQLSKISIPKKLLTEHAHNFSELLSENSRLGEDDCSRTLLFVACVENLPAINTFVISCLKFPKKKLRDFLFRKNSSSGSTALHAAVFSDNLVSAREILNYTESNLGIEAAKELLLSYNNFSCTAVHMAIQDNNLEFLKIFLDFANDKFDDFSVVLKFNDPSLCPNALQLALEYNALKCATAILEFIQQRLDRETWEDLEYDLDSPSGFKKTLDRETLENLLFGEDSSGFPLIFLANKHNIETLKGILRFVAQKCETEYAGNIIFAKDFQGRNILHRFMYQDDTEAAEALLKYAKSYYDIDVIEKMAKAKDNNGRTPLHYTVCNQNSKSVTWLMGHIKHHFSPTVGKNLLFLRDSTKNGYNVLHNAVLSENIKSITQLFDYVKHNFDWDCQIAKEMVFFRDTSESSILHLALIRGDLETAKGILDCIKNNLGLQTLKEICYAKDSEGNTALQVAIHSTAKKYAIEFDEKSSDSNFDMSKLFKTPINDIGIALGLIDYLKLNLDLSTLKQLIFEENWIGNHALQTAVTTQKLESVTALLDYIKDNFDINIAKELLLTKNKMGNNSLQYAISMWKRGSLALIQYVSGCFDCKMEEILFAKSTPNKISLINTIMGTTDRNSLELLNYVKHELTIESIGKLIFDRNSYVRSTLQSALFSNNSNKAIEILEYVKYKFGLESLEELIFSKDSSGNSVLQNAILSGSLNPAERILKYVKLNFNIEFLKKLAFSKNGKGCNLISCFQNNNKFIVILDYIKLNLGVHNIKELVLSRDNDGMNGIYNLLGSENLISLFEYIKTNLGLEIVKEAVNTADFHKMTPLHSVAEKGDLKTAQCLVQHGADVFAENSHDTVLHRAVAGNNLDLIQLILDAIVKQSAEKPENIFRAINFANSEGDTPIMWAVKHGQFQATQLLLKCVYVDVKATNKME